MQINYSTMPYVTPGAELVQYEWSRFRSSKVGGQGQPVWGWSLVKSRGREFDSPLRGHEPPKTRSGGWDPYI